MSRAAWISGSFLRRLFGHHSHSIKWDRHLGIAPRRRCIHCSQNLLEAQSNPRPFGAASQYDDGYPALRQILLVTNTTISRDEQLEARSLCGRKECSVGQPIPVARLSRDDSVKCEGAYQTDRYAVVKQNPHW